ncbi:nucleoside-diphosphate kinase [Persicirhabdus sediminis]|uniref:Nucleoside diphosphate kinase n=1 Tax=Persicirhabdus sediminis TaxID=454144 RepID=A0A8J7MF88_9BACT|nr:nucleoside-diphosphate kinase [Persicirhabdus sediminis]MBK1791922.1 nucleoside-diphosphate kinase [Persicirhabdus sediminis]
MAIETTLILFKPDAIEKNITGDVLTRYQAEGFAIRGIKMMQLSEDLLREHYAHVAHLTFYPAIEKFMTSSPVIALALEGENVIERVRDILGPTNSTEAPAGTVRGDFGENMMVNVCHASDSPEAAEIEVNRFFKPEEIFAPSCATA